MGSHTRRRMKMRFKSLLRPLLTRTAGREERLTPAMLGGVRSVLIVRPNFRIGNALIATPLIGALRERFPGAAIDFLATDRTACLLDGLPLRRVIPLERRHARQPIRLLRLLGDLRHRHYDLAVEGGRGSFSGTLLTALCGARYRMGLGPGAPGIPDVRVGCGSGSHAYDGAAALAEALGVPCARKPVYRVAESERREAHEVLKTLDLVEQGRVRPYLGLSPSGRGEKRWPVADWEDLVDQLGRRRLPVVVFLGPGQRKLGRSLARLAMRNVRILEPQPLRLFAAICAEAALMVTADSGPMHLAAALGVPTIAILESPRSLRYGPRGEEDRALFRPDLATVIDAITSHPASGTASRTVGEASGTR